MLSKVTLRKRKKKERQKDMAYSKISIDEGIHLALCYD
jgi:hypothetical protein